jgi:SAM-dependent methyltransferase
MERKIMHLDQGIPTIASYKNLLKSSLFRSMELFSNQFLKKNKSVLEAYNKKWVSDPFHQWSRQYEYPFVYSYIRDYRNTMQTDGLKILDAGSGVTFFPHYLSSIFPEASVACCDRDPSFVELFSKINKTSNTSNVFYPSDIRHLPFHESAYDIIYCISVLEHTDDFEMIIKEFHRIVKQDGLLIVTFDISMDGRDDIPREKAVELIESLEKHFSAVQGFYSKQALERLDSDEIVTTRYIRKFDKTLLPWRNSGPKSFKDILRFRAPKPFFTNLTCFCEAFTKPAP